MRRRATALVILLRVAALACCLQLFLAYPLETAAQQPAGAAATTQQPAAPAAPADPNAQTSARGRGGRGPQPVDPRVQIRMHYFAETNEDVPYAQIGRAHV